MVTTTGMLHMLTKETVATEIAIKIIRLSVDLFGFDGEPLKEAPRQSAQNMIRNGPPIT